MKNQLVISLLVALVCAMASGCSSAGPRKYVFFGDPQPEKVEMFEDYWEDYPFKPDDPELPLRRGKGGVIRFFKKGSYSKAILVDGDLTVKVYYSQREGVTLTQPDAQMVVTSEELNEKHRKFDKETGYSYHVFLDLGEYDQPEEEITILSVFKDAKTGQVTLSKEIRTKTLGTSPPVKKEKVVPETEEEKIARRILGDEKELENPIAELQARYSIKNKRREEELDATKNTRVRETIDVSNSRFEDLDKSNPNKSVSYLQQIQKNRDEALQKIMDDNLAKESFYREKRSQEAEKYRIEQASRSDNISSLRDAPGMSYPMNFDNVPKSYIDLQKATSQNYENIASQFSERAMEEYAKKSDSPASEKGAAPNNDAMMLEDARARYAQESKSQEQIYGSPLANGYELPKPSHISSEVVTKPSEQDSLNDLLPDPSAPPTEIYVKKMM